MSEAYPAVKPWEWLQIPEFWTDKVAMYLKAKGEIESYREEQRRKRDQAG